MINQEQAIEFAQRLFATEGPASEVESIEAKLIDGRWSVLFYKRSPPSVVESPGFWLILVDGDSGMAQWSDDVL
jgi:hypothetical protein